MWTSRWGDDGKSSPTALPPFGARIWRFMRFTFFHNILPFLIGYYLLLFKSITPLTRKADVNYYFFANIIILPLLTFSIGFAYSYWKEGPQGDKKTIHGEKS